MDEGLRGVGADRVGREKEMEERESGRGEGGGGGAREKRVRKLERGVRAESVGRVKE